MGVAESRALGDIPNYMSEGWINKASKQELQDAVRICRDNWNGLYNQFIVLVNASIQCVESNPSGANHKALARTVRDVGFGESIEKIYSFSGGLD